MKNNVLRAPLIKTAALLTVISILAYLTASSPEGSLWSSFVTLVAAILRTVQLGLGLIVSLAFCLAVLAGIFLGGVALVSRESAADLANQLRGQLRDSFLYVKSLALGKAAAKNAAGKALDEQAPAGETESALEIAIRSIRQEQAVLARKADELLERFERIGQSAEVAGIAARLEDQIERAGILDSGVGALQEQVAALNARIDALRAATHPAAALEERVRVLEQEIAELRDELSQARVGAGGSEPVEHRLFAHLPDTSVQQRVAELVTETLGTDMSYDQAIDYLREKAGEEVAEIVGAHPSLTREYIRYRRNNR